jgi:uracil-DNA glycosylase family 4
MHKPFGKDKQAVFSQLAAQAQGCRKCENLCDRTAVLSELNGNLDSPILFLAEAPGRNGGDKTRVPLVGDASGANFRKFINSIGLNRENVFVTNTVLCNPRKESGANRKPTSAEIRNCSSFLQEQIEVLEPQIIVTLGTVALEALKTIESHELNVRENAGQIYNWNGRFLVPLYHPSPQVLASHRREKQQLFDYRAVAEALRRISATVEG